ncbi:YncE family protein [Tomitella fengzijianii]|uniref:Uncharacterized protein n=1 Tax=Tomitella fengzijianii TaxID=2597660 RepID=A0A516X2Y6_9ACTN|nr:hypothetical protein [Tomitella fengzijianii]QDQ97403.1 hypothetical protein FO059_08760 [Tomitella fengzijianii]
MTTKVTGYRSTDSAGAVRGRLLPRWSRGAAGTGRRAAAAALAAAALLALSACGSSEGRPDVPTRVPATPVAGPGSPAAPAGEVVVRTADVQALAAAGDGLLAVQSAEPSSISVYAADAPADPLRVVPVPAGAAPMVQVAGVGAQSSPPVVVVPVPGGMLRVNLDSGATDTGDIGGDAISATALPGGGYAVGTADGTVYILGADLAVERTVTGFVSADSLAASGDALLVFDAHQTSITEVDPATGEHGAALRVGKGATRIIADGYGRVIALDTDGGQMLVYGLDPLINRQLAPIGASPAALAADPARGLVWVTFTGTDEVAAFDLSTGEPVEKHRYPTVAFPTSVAVGADGAVYVGSGRDGGVGRISAELIR